MPPIVRIARRVGLVLVALYGLICAGMFVAQRSLVFPGASVETRALAAGAQVVEVPGGTPMLWVPPPSADAPVVVHFHGNGQQVADVQWLGDALQAAGAGYAAVEYPGYGLAGGDPSEDAILAAARAALGYLTGPLGVPRSHLALSGRSLGTGVATAMAAEGWGARVLLVSPYTALPDVAGLEYPWLPVRQLMRDRFDSAAVAAGVEVPVLILHGDDDTLIPVEQGGTLAALFPLGTLQRVPGAGHGDIWEAPGVREAAVRFLARGEYVK